MSMEQREHVRGAYNPKFGRSTCHITCPFCSHVCVAYLWSLGGGGKRCPGCGAKHTNYGVTVREDQEPPRQPAHGALRQPKSGPRA
jgi:hypothetical protein